MPGSMDRDDDRHRRAVCVCPVTTDRPLLENELPSSALAVDFRHAPVMRRT
jgi:hypothetical protein